MIFKINGRSNVRVFGCVTQDNGHWHSGRVLDCHLLIYVTEQSLSMQIGGNVYHANSGDLLFVPKGHPYQPVGDSACTYYVIHFDLEEAERESRQPPAVSALEKTCHGFAYFFNSENENTVKLDILTTPSNQQIVKDILLRASKLDLLQNAEQKMLLDLYFRELLVSLEHMRRDGIQLSHTVKRVLKYIHDNIDAPLSLSDISQALYLSESYIARLFKKQLGESVVTYITKQKVRLATALLINSDMQVSEIAERIGFSSAYYFTTIFTKYTGMSPSAYRQQAL